MPLRMITNPWGFQINNVAGMDIVVVAGDTSLWEFAWPDFDARPMMLN